MTCGELNDSLISILYLPVLFEYLMITEIHLIESHIGTVRYRGR